MGVINADVVNVLKVLRDFDHKHLWAPKLKSVKIHQKINENEFIFSEYYKTPWPATDREFLLKGTLIKKGDQYFINAYSFKSALYKDSKHIQADVTKLNLMLEKSLNNTTKISFEFHGDMKGWMPFWLINLIQKKWPFKFIKELEKRILFINKTKES